MVIKATNIIRRIVAFVMMSVVLLTSSGFKLYSHYCSHKNVANYSIFIPAKACYTATKTSCCGDEIPVSCNAECSNSCCNDEQQFSRYEIESFSSVINNDIKPVELDVFSAALQQLQLVMPVTNVNVLWHLVSEPPSPIPLNKFLSLVQVYLN
jgi:hypothetical protein